MKAMSFPLLLSLLSTLGCAVIGSSGTDSLATKDLVVSLDQSGSLTPPHASLSPEHAVAAIDHEVRQLEIDRTPCGSYVHGTVLGQQFQGTLLRKNSTTLLIVNSISVEVVVDSDGQKSARKIHTPFQIVEMSQMSQFSILAPPSSKFAPNDMKFEADDLTVDAFEFCSGRVQRWVEPTMNSSLSRRNCSPDELAQKLATIPLGSQVALMEESGQKYNAIVSRIGPDGLTLLSCMTQESVAGPDGSSQVRTSCVPWQTIPIQSISTCSIVTSPPFDQTPPNDDDSCDLCVRDIVYRSGRHQSDWKSAENEREVARILTGRPKRFTFPRMGGKSMHE